MREAGRCQQPQSSYANIHSRAVVSPALFSLSLTHTHLCVLGLLEEQLDGGREELQLHLRRLLLERLEEVFQLLVRVVDALRVLPDDPDDAGLLDEARVSWWFCFQEDEVITVKKSKNYTSLSYVQASHVDIHT